MMLGQWHWAAALRCSLWPSSLMRLIAAPDRSAAEYTGFPRHVAPSLLLQSGSETTARRQT